MVFVETGLFTKLLPHYLSDDEYRGLQIHLSQRPDAGDLIRGSGGVRKVRWAVAGKGKSGGLRIEASAEAAATPAALFEGMAQMLGRAERRQ